MTTIMSLFYTCFKLFVIVSGIVFLIQYWVDKKSYIFCHESVAKITRKYVGQEPSKAFDQIYDEFLTTYPGHVLPEENRQWIFMNAGGWMGSMNIVHASLTEYVLFFGTAIHTSGNSGRYWANITDTILAGSFRQWQEGELNSTMFKPGDTVYHYMGEAAAVEWTEGTWMVEYGRGFVPSTLGFALADTFFSTTDFITLYYVLRVYAKALMLELGTFLISYKDSLIISS